MEYKIIEKNEEYGIETETKFTKPLGFVMTLVNRMKTTRNSGFKNAIGNVTETEDGFIVEIVAVPKN